MAGTANFQALLGQPPQAFPDAPRSAASLLSLRTHTLSVFLLRLALGEPFTPCWRSR